MVKASFKYIFLITEKTLEDKACCLDQREFQIALELTELNMC